jgi:hypothetical protein
VPEDSLAVLVPRSRLGVERKMLELKPNSVNSMVTVHLLPLIPPVVTVQAVRLVLLPQQRVHVHIVRVRWLIAGLCSRLGLLAGACVDRFTDDVVQVVETC